MAAGHEIASGPGLSELLALGNIVIFVGAGYNLGRKGIAEFFASRAAGIKERLATSKRELEEVLRNIAEAQRKLSDFDGLKRKMIEDVRREAQALSDKIVSDAEKASKQLLLEAKLAAEQESREAADSIREKLIEEALRAVREQLGRDAAMREKMHESMIESFTSQLQETH